MHTDGEGCGRSGSIQPRLEPNAERWGEQVEVTLLRRATHTGSPSASTQALPSHQTGWPSVVSNQTRPTGTPPGRSPVAPAAGTGTVASFSTPMLTVRS